MAERMIVVDKLKMSYRFKTRGYVGVFVLLAMIAHVSTAYSGERRDTRPNILFAIADDWSFGHAGASGAFYFRKARLFGCATELGTVGYPFGQRLIE